MKKLGIYAVMAVFVGVMSGCLDDDNNYNYKQINDLQGGNFNIENINSGYNLIEGDELVLAPTFNRQHYARRQLRMVHRQTVADR